MLVNQRMAKKISGPKRSPKRLPIGGKSANLRFDLGSYDGLDPKTWVRGNQPITVEQAKTLGS